MMSGEPLRSEDSNYDAPGSALDTPGDEAALVDADRCARCGYLLYGLADEQRCPECAFPVGASRQGPWLKFADPTWLRRIVIGAMVVAFTTAVMSATPLIWQLPFTAWQHAWLSFGLSIIYIFDLAGYWLLTDPDPSGVGDAVGINVRKALRLFLLISFGVFVIAVIDRHILGSPSDTRVLAIWSVGEVVGFVAWIFRFGVLRRLAGRIPDIRCARLAGALRYGYVIPSTCFDVLMIFQYWQYLRLMTIGTMIELPSWLKPGVGIALFIAWLFVVYLMVRQARLLRREYRSAVAEARTETYSKASEGDA